MACLTRSVATNRDWFARSGGARMIVKCLDCHINYDDEYRWTICPHDLLRTPEESARFDKAWDLLIRGRLLEWNHPPLKRAYTFFEATQRIKETLVPKTWSKPEYEMVPF